MTYLGHCSIAIIGHCLNQHGDAADAVAFVSDLVVVCSLEFATAALDRSIDGIVWHVYRFGIRNCLAKPSIRINIAAAARACRDGDLFDHLGKDLAALGVRRAFFVLNCVPLGVS